MARSQSMPRAKAQAELPLPARVPTGRGGWRPGAGRPRKVGRRSVEHSRRPFLDKATPVHVTLRCRHEVGRLRRRAGYRAVRDALFVSLPRLERFRIVHVSIQATHIHLLVEASDKRQLGRGLQGFAISCARQLNRRLGRQGGVFADRYHARALRSPREVRNALGYVLNNWRHHREHLGHGEVFDFYSSARAFDGWSIRRQRKLAGNPELLPTAVARTWLLTTGWRRHRLISPSQTPGAVDDA
jgi:putative transposase